MPVKPEAALVTGASAGIGRAIAEALLAEGRTVVNLDHAMPAWSHANLVSFQADLANEAQTRRRTSPMRLSFFSRPPTVS